MMTSLGTYPSSVSLTILPFKHGKKPCQQCPPYRARSSTLPAMPTRSMTTQGVEHIVLLRVKDDADPSKVNTMVNELQSLVSMEQVRHLTVGPLLRINEPIATTTPFSDLRFTHLLHSRYDSKEDLEAYKVHPSHVSAATGSVFPVVDDIMAVDWLAGYSALPPHPPPGSGVRVSFLKLKDGRNSEVKDEVLRVVRDIKDIVGEISHLSCGKNFSPARAKGFSVASLAVFPGRRELDRVDPSEGLTKVREHLESVIVVDYVVPLEQQ